MPWLRTANGPSHRCGGRTRVYARAALDLSKNALQRIARSLWIAQNGATEKLRALSSSYQVTTGSAITMMQWRMTMEQHAEAAE